MNGGDALRSWIINDFVMGPTGMGNPDVSGFYFDDGWTNTVRSFVLACCVSVCVCLRLCSYSYVCACCLVCSLFLPVYLRFYVYVYACVWFVSVAKSDGCQSSWF